ncbi:MAG: hypothetical protein ABI707_03965 [Ferruginibacter sp.]
MRKGIVMAGICFFCLKAKSQDNFEGKITYRISSSMEKENSTMEVLFGDQKIKVLVTPSVSKSNNKEDLILDFKNGVFYKITNRNKTYAIDSLKKSGNDIINSQKLMVALPEKNAILLGYKSSAFTIPAAEIRGLPSTNVMATFWYADSLQYKIPEKYTSVQMVPLFTNGSSVGLGIKLVMQMEQNKNDTSEFLVLTIEPKKIPDSLLGLPPGYALASENNAFDENQVTADTTMVFPDTSYEATPAKPAIKNGNKPVQKNKNPGKKQLTDQLKSPARKPNN